MGRKLWILSTTFTIFLAIIYQIVLKDLIFITLGVGRTHQKISEFPFQCRRLHSPLLESCEDMILDEETRTLYAACSSISSRRGWSPGGDKYNTSVRDLKDHVSVLNIDDPGADGLYGLHSLEITGNYSSSSGGSEIDIHGFDIEAITPTRSRFWMINHRPPFETEETPLDATKFGANSTIEVFELERGSKNLDWVRTISSEAVYTPNNIVTMGDGGILVTNDHTSKTGGFRRLEMILGGGSIAYCPPPTSSNNPDCTLALTDGLHFANGITRHPVSGEIFIAHSAKGYMTAHTFHPSNRTLSPGKTVPVKMPMDNLSIDSKGDVYMAAFPKVLALLEAMDGAPKPEGQWVEIPSTIFKVRRVQRKSDVEYVVEKVLEDIEGMQLPGSTTAVHDTRTGSIWMGGVASPFITVCEPIA